jgi:hypothetical protein
MMRIGVNAAADPGGFETGPGGFETGPGGFEGEETRAASGGCEL